ncbi:MAG: DUF4232 domain-containing protein [Streptosporangiaceae bacterium]
MIPSAPAARRAIAAAALASGLVLLAACGSKASPSSGGTTTKTFTTTASPRASSSAPSPSSSSAPAGPAACVTSALSASLGQGNGAAGSTIVPLEFRNTSSSACTLFGYPGVSFVTGPGGSQIGNSASEDSATPRESVTLAAGSTAHALLQVAVAQNYPPSRCHLVQAHWLKIFPPGETAPLYVKFNSATCTAKSIRVLAVQTVQPGAANS